MKQYLVGNELKFLTVLAENESSAKLKYMKTLGLSVAENLECEEILSFHTEWNKLDFDNVNIPEIKSIVNKFNIGAQFYSKKTLYKIDNSNLYFYSDITEKWLASPSSYLEYIQNSAIKL